MKAICRSLAMATATLMTGLAATLGGALAQDATGTNAVPAQAAAPTGWFKICETEQKSKKEVCAMNLRVLGNNGQAIANVRVVEIEGQSQKILSMAVPPGLLIQPGMRVQIDGTRKGTAKFVICAPQVCRVEAVFNTAFVTSMKRGNEMKVIGIGGNGKQVEFPVTLAGFTASYDGPPIDPATLASNSRTLQERLQQKAEEARQRLLEEKQPDGGETAAPAPAQSN